MTKYRKTESNLYFLDSFSTEDLSKWETKKEKLLRYHWDLYSALAYERQKAADVLRTALLAAGRGPYEFSKWQRQIRYKYSLTPLSPKGSLLEPGGRFNIPDVNPNQIPPFPALYIAENKETTLQEAGQQSSPNRKLSPLDLALVKKDSISIVATRGKLESVIDLYSPTTLKPFLDIIKGFTIPDHVFNMAKEIGLKPPSTVKSVKSLLDSLLEPNWRAMCIQLDIPANCQIFGQLVASAGITGILYPSKFTKKKCLAIYPQNFDSESFIAVDGDYPEGTISRLDAEVWASMKTTL